MLIYFESISTGLPPSFIKPINKGTLEKFNIFFSYNGSVFWIIEKFSCLKTLIM